MAKTQTPKAITGKAVKAAKVVANMAATKKLVKPTNDDHTIQPEQRAADAAADRRVKSDAAMHFAVQQMTTPVVAPQTPPQATDAFKAELAALQAKHGIAPKSVVVKAPKADKLQRNGVTRPAENTICGIIWAAADEISEAIHGIAPVALLREHAKVVGVNSHTVKTQYARWRLYNGVHGRLPTIPSVHQTVGEYNGMKPI